MATLFDKLPTILVLAVLVGIFVALGRHVRSPRLKLWTAAWVLIFIHFFVQLFEPAQGDPPPLAFMIDLGSLQLSGLFFIASLSIFFADKKLTLGLLSVTGIPVLAYTAGLAYNIQWRLLYIASIAVIFYGSVLYVTILRKLTIEALLWVPAVLITGSVAIYKAWRSNFDFGFLALLTVGFALPGLFYWRRYRRWSPGVITSAGGFLLWGAVFPIGGLLDTYFPALKINPELWNTPKFFVAFGMILTLLEDKSKFLESASKREHTLNQQLQRFSAITSRLLSGVDPISLCPEIAQTISDTSTFRRVTIRLTADGQSLYPAGYAGLDADAVEQLKHHCANVWRMDRMLEICHAGAKLGQSCCLVRGNDIDQERALTTNREYPPNPFWQKGDKIFVPLKTTRGTPVGFISLDEPRDVTRVTPEETSKIELLASDLAVTLDNSVLHRQLMRSEKLAAMGQLVAGVAHELNNPLASIVGYSELLTDEVGNGPSRQKVDKMLREAQRMKRIIENLLRFARQNSLEKKSANLKTLLEEVLALREYHLRNHDVEVELNIEPGLPSIALDEDQFKQILLNLLNNSIDALESTARKKIRVEAFSRGERVVLRFDDNGPGFSDMNRAFDPFYTTKPVGKGTGLGLSICYGIVKEHGGDIHAFNLEPRGARVTLELPINAPIRQAAIV